MADVYKVKVSLVGLEDIMWREIEFSSLSTVAKLGYAILATFETQASHLFNIKYKENRYEIMFDCIEYNYDNIIDPTNIKLSSLKLNVGDELSMEYDYGDGWEFKIELLSITEMKKGTGNHYPFVLNGQGRGLIEDIFPSELLEIVEKKDKENVIPILWDWGWKKDLPWDYEDFDLRFCNLSFKDSVRFIQEAYEEE